MNSRAYWLFGSTVLGIVALALFWHAMAWVFEPMRERDIDTVVNEWAGK